MSLLDIFESPCQESDIQPLPCICPLIEHHSSVLDNACSVDQGMPRSIPRGAKFHTTALPKSSPQGTSIDLNSAFTLLQRRMDQTGPSIANATKTNNLLLERITAQEQDKVSLHPDLSENEGVELG